MINMCKCENCEWLEKVYFKYDDDLYEEYPLCDVFYCTKHGRFFVDEKVVPYRR